MNTILILVTILNIILTGLTWLLNKQAIIVHKEVLKGLEEG
jgi:hypothetical protein